MWLEAFSPAQLWRQLQELLAQGGAVLTVIMIVTFALWWLVMERQLFFWRGRQKSVAPLLEEWKHREDKTSWYAEGIRQQLLSLAQQQLNNHIEAIKTIVAIAPLLGLLGTVTGMIDVFDVMATTGSSNSRAMAAGVSKATIPTMAGMVVSLAGLLFIARLQKQAAKHYRIISDEMTEVRS